MQSGARFGMFGEWQVPLYYTSILEEHEAVRKRAGLFDISHMGEVWVEGTESLEFLQRLLPRDLRKIKDGQALYAPLLNEAGGFIDDVIVYKFQDQKYLIITNAANTDKDFEWIQNHLSGSLKAVNQSDRYGLLSIQGPLSAQIVSNAFGKKFLDLKYYRFAPWGNGMIARTGYTGEDGFEIMAECSELSGVWERLFQSGRESGLVPVGFGARDTLRLEASMLLYGHDMDDQRTPLEAGVAWAVDLEKNAYIGREALVQQKKKGIQQRLAGFELLDRGVPRQGYEIRMGHEPVGTVTSGSYCPTLKKNMGMAYLNAEAAAPGTGIDIIIRDKAVHAKVVAMPFYRRQKLS